MTPSSQPSQLISSEAEPASADRHIVPLKVQVGWGLGSLGTVIVLSIQSVFLLFFFTSVLGIQPGRAGTLILAAKLFDLVWGVVVGRVSDRSHTKWGRRRPFMLVGAFFTTIGILLVFCPPIISPAYQIATLVALGVGYGLFNVPYLAMPAEMTIDPAARTRLISWRIIFVSIATLFTIGLLPSVVVWGGGGRAGFVLLAEMTAGLVGVSMLTTFAMTAPARFLDRTEAKPDRQTDWAAIWTNRPFLLLMAAKIMQLVGLAVGSAILLFFFTAVLGGAAGNVSLWSFIAYSVSIVSTPLWARIAAGREKRGLYIAGCIGYGLVTLSWLLAGPGEPFALIALRAALVGPCIACLLLMGQAMLPDTIEYDRKRSGFGREGVYAAVYNFVEKGTSAAGPFIVGWILQLVGFQPHPGAGVEQTPEAIRGVYIAMAVIPGALYVISTLPLVFYKLTASDLTAMPLAFVLTEALEGRD